MFTLSNDYGVIPYDGFYLHSRQWPLASFTRWAEKAARRRPDLWDSGWRYHIALTVNGAPGALSVSWSALRIGQNMPKARLWINPATAGLNSNEVLAILRSILPAPDDEPLVQMDTRIDLAGPQLEIARRLAMTRARVNHAGDRYESTHYQGSRRSTQLRIYDKGLESGGTPGQTTRVEVSQRFKNNANKHLTRPTLMEFLRGDCVSMNAFLRMRVDDQPTTALFDLYQRQAWPWHDQFRPEAAGNLVVVWTEELGLTVRPQGEPDSHE